MMPRTTSPKAALTYDASSDTLHIDVCAPYKEQDSDEIGFGLLARTNPKTGAIENIEVRAFQKRLADGQAIELPLRLEGDAAST
jgi:hypothetical protein